MSRRIEMIHWSPMVLSHVYDGGANQALLWARTLRGRPRRGALITAALLLPDAKGMWSYPTGARVELEVNNHDTCEHRTLVTLEASDLAQTYARLRDLHIPLTAAADRLVKATQEPNDLSEFVQVLSGTVDAWRALVNLALVGAPGLFHVALTLGPSEYLRVRWEVPPIGGYNGGYSSFVPRTPLTLQFLGAESVSAGYAESSP